MSSNFVLTVSFVPMSFYYLSLTSMLPSESTSITSIIVFSIAFVIVSLFKISSTVFIVLLIYFSSTSFSLISDVISFNSLSSLAISSFNGFVYFFNSCIFIISF